MMVHSCNDPSPRSSTAPQLIPPNGTDDRIPEGGSTTGGGGGGGGAGRPAQEQRAASVHRTHKAVSSMREQHHPTETHETPDWTRAGSAEHSKRRARAVPLQFNCGAHLTKASSDLETLGHNCTENRLDTAYSRRFKYTRCTHAGTLGSHTRRYKYSRKHQINSNISTLAFRCTCHHLKSVTTTSSQ
jgi:hypothetical protein